MSEFLKVLELVDQDRMTQMQIRRRGIEACFHTQRPLVFQGPSQLRFEFGLLNTSTTPRRIKSSCWDNGVTRFLYGEMGTGC